MVSTPFIAARKPRSSFRLHTVTSTGTPSGRPGERRDGRIRVRTSLPEATRWRMSARPIKPVPPVTKIISRIIAEVGEESRLACILLLSEARHRETQLANREEHSNQTHAKRRNPMAAHPLPPQNTRIGFHYFPDTVHFRESDLHAWLPELRSLGASWLTLVAPSDRAIPEYFLQGLIASGIEPILHFQLSLKEPAQTSDLKIFFDSYAKWGVHYVVFFDRPNSRSSWSASSWAQEDLVERFLDRFVPLAEAALQAGLTPVLPPLEPGGDYWDTAFLASTLRSLQRRSQTQLLEKLGLSAYVWSGEHSLNWGAGGPERWPGARPYFTPANEEDQRGFRIFDWYLAISQSILGRACPVLAFGAGTALDHSITPAPAINPTAHAQTQLTIARLLSGETVNDTEKPQAILDPIPTAVLACNFWLLAAAPASRFLAQAWFQPGSQTLPVVGTFRQWVETRFSKLGRSKSAETVNDPTGLPPINHYLLLPAYEWGVSDWHLEIIRPFVKKHHPTIGFSLEEARHASKVTVIGGEQAFPDDAIDHLRSAGCLVERISGDGTTIATILAER